MCSRRLWRARIPALSFHSLHLLTLQAHTAAEEFAHDDTSSCECVCISKKAPGHPFPGHAARGHDLTATTQSACGSEVFARQTAILCAIHVDINSLLALSVNHHRSPRRQPPMQLRQTPIMLCVHQFGLCFPRQPSPTLSRDILPAYFA